jgi:hypothetical protein
LVDGRVFEDNIGSLPGMTFFKVNALPRKISLTIHPAHIRFLAENHLVATGGPSERNLKWRVDKYHEIPINPELWSHKKHTIKQQDIVICG